MWDIAYFLLFLLAVGIIWSGYIVVRDRARQLKEPRPTYYVKHPDGSFTPADPQP